MARLELHTFASTTLTDQEFLVGKKDGRPVVNTGELRIPRPGTDRLPAVVLLHGSGGVVVNSETRQPFTFKDPCVERGATIASDSQAHAEAEKAVRDLLGTVLKAR